MLDVSVDTICFLIQMARVFHAKEEVVIPEQPLNATDDWALQVLANHRDDPTYQEFVTTIRDLEPDQQANLVALMWIGRGDYEADEWEEALEQAVEASTAYTAEYLISKPLVSDYLEAALNQLGYACNE
jgi:hypothetical protein